MLSPDASKMAIGFSPLSTENRLHVWDFAGETRTPLTLGEKGGRLPLWSPDGSRIIYDSMDGRISAKPANNTKPPEVLVDAIEGRPGRVSPAFLKVDGLHHQ
jgi:Tol biopolymer transport system component